MGFLIFALLACTGLGRGVVRLVCGFLLLCLAAGIVAS